VGADHNDNLGYGYLQTIVDNIHTATLRLQPYGGNVGIGNINPTEKLDVVGNIKVSGQFKLGADHIIQAYTGGATDRALLIGYGGNTDRIGLGQASSGNATVGIYDNASSATPNLVVIDEAKLGIGTGITNGVPTALTEALEVVGNIKASGGIITDGYISLNSANNNGLIFRATPASDLDFVIENRNFLNADRLVFSTGIVANDFDHTPALIIMKATGNVGIGSGVTSASEALDVSGNIKASGTVLIGTTLKIQESATQAVAVGANAGVTTQGVYSVAIGSDAGKSGQSNYSVALGPQAGRDSQGATCVAIGYQAARDDQANDTVAIGKQAGRTSQRARAVAIGYSCGGTSQQATSTAIGYYAGSTFQGEHAVAIGNQAGTTSQGTHAIAIGTLAGQTNQHANSIVINASGGGINTAGASTLHIKPISPGDGTHGALEYSLPSGLVTYDTGNSSDDRLKHNEEPVSNVLGSINQLQLLKYDKTYEMLAADFNGDLGDIRNYRDAGFIAQEVAKIPELAWLVRGGGTYEEVSKPAEYKSVETTPAEYANVLVDEETGTYELVETAPAEYSDVETTPAEHKTVEIPYNINYRCLSNYSIQAIQELSAENTTLKSQVADLLTRVQALENA
jgi:hypothetical protein